MNTTPHWSPSASLEHLRARAGILRHIRDFFAARDVMEVETPLLCHTSVTDPYIQSIPAICQFHSEKNSQTYFLQTSPEYAMKRLLSAGSGSIYQLTKAFRQGDIGRIHNPEFTMLEWYRIGFDHHQLMNEMDELLQYILNTTVAERKTYAELFQHFLNIDPHFTNIYELERCAKENSISIATNNIDENTWLDILFTHCIEPHLGMKTPCFIYDFPTSKAALARIQPTNPPVASRFEVYYKGIELANGFHELQDANEQRERFAKNNVERKLLGLSEMPIDEFFLSALQNGLPDCAGVALGVDRLVMLALGLNCVAEIMSFDFLRA